jgi:hypothetical protein
MSETLKATVLRFSQFGNPFEVIVECEEIIEIPKSGNKLLVKIIASTINPADIITIRGCRNFLNLLNDFYSKFLTLFQDCTLLSQSFPLFLEMNVWLKY